MKTTAIEKTPHKRLTKKQLQQLASFTDPGTVLTALAKEGWTIEKSIKHLVDIAEGSRELVGKNLNDNIVEKEVKTSVQLNAIKYLNQLIIDAMERSGLMVLATKKYVGEDGEEVRFSGHVVSSVLRGQKEQTTPAELSTDTIEKESNNGNNRSKNGKNGRDESKEEGEEGAEGRERKSSLSTSKSPAGREAESGHFDGIAKQSKGDPNEDNSADFI